MPTERVEPPLDEVFRPYLLDDERLVWAGSPIFRLFEPSDATMVPFSIIWAGFACFWEYGVLQSAGERGGPPPYFAVFGIPFVVIGLHLTIGRFFYKAWLVRRTFYALTDRRALILRREWSDELISVDLATTAEVAFTRRGALGSIRFGPLVIGGKGMPVTGRRGAPTFEHISDADAVYRLATKRAA